MALDTTSAAEVAAPDGASRPARRAPDRILLAGVCALAVVAALLRGVSLGAHLPQLVAPDEPTTVSRALAALDGDLTPPAWDWPPASAYLLAGTLAVVQVADDDVTVRPAGTYRVGRVLFAGVSVLVVVLTAALAASVAGADVRRRRVAALAAAAAMAVGYLGVRTGRMVHPEQLQLALMVASLLATLRFDRDGRARDGWLAGGLAGLAGATKYLGVVAVVAAAAVVLWPREGGGVRWRRLAAIATATVVGFLVGTLGTAATDAGSFGRGFWAQVRHQVGGHLGYEAEGSGWWLHLTQSLPGHWGWLVTALAVAGVGLVVVRGDRAQRLVAAPTLVLIALVGASNVRFPHYVLLVTPLLAAFAGLALATLVARQRLVVRVGAAVVVAVSLLPSLGDDLRLLRVARAPDTRELATSLAATLPGPVWAEAYTLAGPPADREVFAWGDTAEVVDCDCYALLSSYMEQRYRRRPDLYARQVGVYDEIRRVGEVVAVIAPSRPLRYDWDLLPAWGLRTIGLTGPLGATGPTVTVVDLTRA